MVRGETATAAGLPWSASPAQFDGRSERQTLLAHVFHVSNDGIMVHELLSSPQMGRFIDVNDRMCQVLGYTREEILNLAPSDILDAQARKVMLDLARRIERDGRMSVRDDSHPQGSTTRAGRGQREFPGIPGAIHDALASSAILRTASGCRSSGAEGRAGCRRNCGPGRRSCGTPIGAGRDGPASWPKTGCGNIPMLEAFSGYDHAAGVSGSAFQLRGSTKPTPGGRQGPGLLHRQEPLRPLSARGEPGIRADRADPAAVSCYAKPFTYPDQPERGVTYWDWRLTPLCDEAPGAVSGAEPG